MEEWHYLLFRAYGVAGEGGGVAHAVHALDKARTGIYNEWTGRARAGDG
jgi:hypothetical protein